MNVINYVSGKVKESQGNDICESVKRKVVDR